MSYKAQTKEQLAESKQRAITILKEEKIAIKDGVSDIGNDTFTKCVPAINEECTVDMVHMVDDVKRVYFAAVLEERGHEAIDHLAKHKNIDKVEQTIEVGGSVLNITTNRSKEVRNPSTGEISIKHGTFTVGLTDDAARKSVGMMKPITEDLAEYALKKLGK